MTPAPLRADLELALAAALRAGAAVARSFGGEHNVRHKSPGQPLTDADLEADRLLREDLMSARSDYGWLSEETADRPDRLARKRVWIVDPIDGTNSFIKGRPEFALSIGLVEDGAPVVGVVYNPVAGELYWAVRGAGAYRALSAGSAAAALSEGRPIRVSSGYAPPYRLAASRSEIRNGEFDAFEDWTVVPTGSTAYKLGRVAAGDSDAFVSRGPKSEWDVCAGGLLVSEAGGAATDTLGRPLRYNRPDVLVRGIIAGSGAAHRALLARVLELPPTERLRDYDATAGSRED